MKPSSAKAKGRRLQNQVAKDIRALPDILDGDVKPAIMGESGRDIQLSPRAELLFSFAIECKNQERLNIWKALKQAGENAEGLTPLVVFTRNGHGLVAALPWDRLLEMQRRIMELEEIEDAWMNDGPGRDE